MHMQRVCQVEVPVSCFEWANMATRQDCLDSNSITYFCLPVVLLVFIKQSDYNKVHVRISSHWFLIYVYA